MIVTGPLPIMPCIFFISLGDPDFMNITPEPDRLDDRLDDLRLDDRLDDLRPAILYYRQR
jgi:hypothetical protein